MESPDVVGVLLRKLGKHKQKPVQFVSVAGGVQKRLETNLKGRRNSRLTLIDSIRNLPRCLSPAVEKPPPLSEAQQKVERRRQQLEKWKEEKEKQKKEQAAKKKTPFRTGVAHQPLKYVPPPPVKVLPSTSGRVTRSQASKKNESQRLPEPKPAKASKSFAPKNASFRPPEIKNVTKVPKLAPVSKSKGAKTYNFDFSFAPSNNEKLNTEKVSNAKQTRTKTAKRDDLKVETRMTTRRNAKEQEKKGNVKKVPQKSMLTASSSSDSDGVLLKMTVKVRTPSPRVTKSSKNFFSSSSSDMDNDITQKTSINPFSASSSSDMDMTAVEKPSKPTPKGGKKKDVQKSPILGSKTPIQSRRSRQSLGTPKNPVPKSESSSEERLRSPKSTEIDLTNETPKNVSVREERISPCVTMSRGKDNARREMKQKIEEGLLDEYNGDSEHVEHFRRQLSSEVARLTELCDSWDKIREQTVLAEHVQDEIFGAVGQGRLLVSSKLQQFAGLLQRAARPEPGTPLVTPEDLHGFWDMVFMQIENVDMRFKRLEQRRARDWADEPVAAPARKAPARGPARKAGKAAGGPSRLREMIAAARKAKKETEELPTVAAAQPEDSKTFEAGFFSVRSPVRSPAPATPNNKHNLLKAVLSSEAKKASASKSSSSFAMLRASIISRNLEADGIAPLPQTPLNPINLGATPGRSILKSTTDVATKSGKKSIKVVLFGDEDTAQQTVPKIDTHTDSGHSSMDIEKDVENKVTPRRKSRLSRQDAISNDDSGVVTRSRRKSLQTPQTEEKNEKSRRSSRRKPLQETDVNVQEEVVDVPKRSTRRRKSNIQVVA